MHLHDGKKLFPFNFLPFNFNTGSQDNTLLSICGLLFTNLFEKIDFMQISMGRRLEKYHLFCNNAFLSLFTIKFVRYIYVRQNTL